MAKKLIEIKKGLWLHVEEGKDIEKAKAKLLAHLAKGLIYVRGS